VAANNEYDRRYVEYFTGIRDVMLLASHVTAPVENGRAVHYEQPGATRIINDLQKSKTMTSKKRTFLVSPIHLTDQTPIYAELDKVVASVNSV